MEEILFTPIEHRLKYTVYQGKFNGCTIKIRKNKNDGNIKYLITSDLINSGLVKINGSRIAFNLNKYEGKWMALKIE